jgi:hypothetical protein
MEPNSISSELGSRIRTAASLIRSSRCLSTFMGAGISDHTSNDEIGADPKARGSETSSNWIVKCGRR